MVNYWQIPYAVIMIAAIVTCSLLLRRTQASLPISWWQKLGIGIGGFCGAMIGAKLPFVLADWEGLRSGAAWFAHGKTIMCGIVGAYFGVEIGKWTVDVRVKTGDTFAVPVALAVAIGRLACFTGGCCYGKPTNLPWGVCFSTAVDGPTLPRHPTQLYEAGFHLVMAAVMFVMAKRGIFRGQLAKFYILCYLPYRFLTEFIRPEPIYDGGFTWYQYIAVALVPVFAALWYLDHQRFQRQGYANLPET